MSSKVEFIEPLFFASSFCGREKWATTTEKKDPTCGNHDMVLLVSNGHTRENPHIKL